MGLNWHSFGANGYEVEPVGISSYEAYTKRAAGNVGINNHIQSIVQVDHIADRIWDDPHHPTMAPGHFQFNEKRQQFNGPWNIPPTQDTGFIAHYYTRSRDYWAIKYAKTRADTGTFGGTIADFDHHQTYMNTIEDLTVKNIWDQCKK